MDEQFFYGDNDRQITNGGDGQGEGTPAMRATRHVFSKPML